MHALREQVEHLRATDVNRLKKCEDWDGASTHFIALIELQEKRLESYSADSPEDQARNDRKKLWSHQHELGYVLFRSRELVQSESSLRRAYNNRSRELGEKHADTQASIRQLCHVLRNMDAEEKKLEAENIYHKNWRVREGALDDFAIENGFELGKLYQEQKRYEEAEIQLKKVWGLRKARNVFFNVLLQTARPLTEVLHERGKTDDRLPILQYLWERRREPLSGWQVEVASILADHHRAAKEYADATPVWKAVWKARNACPEPGLAGCECDSCCQSKEWFTAGCRYASSSRLEGGRENWLTAKKVFRDLRKVIYLAPKDLYPSALIIDWQYARTLKKLQETEACTTVYQTRWVTSTSSENDWRKNDLLLSFGFEAGNVLAKYGKFAESRNVLQQVYNAKKALVESENEATTKAVLAVGKQLCEVLRSLELFGKARQLKSEMDNLSWSSTVATAGS